MRDAHGVTPSLRLLSRLTHHLATPMRLLFLINGYDTEKASYTTTRLALAAHRARSMK